MSWYRHEVNSLLELRLLKLNGEWDAYWNQRRAGLLGQLKVITEIKMLTITLFPLENISTFCYKK
ncbi:MAG: hypothetical protein N3B16_11740 [Candidatus Aminicenantes bacterium]|nr:hypothetical protein [Candidatus Aminicenantes bacterium]